MWYKNILHELEYCTSPKDECNIGLASAIYSCITWKLDIQYYYYYLYQAFPYLAFIKNVPFPVPFHMLNFVWLIDRSWTHNESAQNIDQRQSKVPGWSRYWNIIVRIFDKMPGCRGYWRARASILFGARVFWLYAMQYAVFTV